MNNIYILIAKYIEDDVTFYNFALTCKKFADICRELTPRYRVSQYSLEHLEFYFMDLIINHNIFQWPLRLFKRWHRDIFHPGACMCDSCQLDFKLMNAFPKKQRIESITGKNLPFQRSMIIFPNVDQVQIEYVIEANCVNSKRVHKHIVINTEGDLRLFQLDCLPLYLERMTSEEIALYCEKIEKTLFIQMYITLDHPRDNTIKMFDEKIKPKKSHGYLTKFKRCFSESNIFNVCPESRDEIQRSMYTYSIYQGTRCNIEEVLFKNIKRYKRSPPYYY
jgi:hypothetical protein